MLFGGVRGYGFLSNKHTLCNKQELQNHLMQAVGRKGGHKEV